MLDAKEVPTAGYAAGGSLYLVQTIPAAEHTADVYELMRADPGSRRIVAARRFSSELDDTLLAGGTLWVTTSAGRQTSLWGLDPRSLVLRSHDRVPTSSSTEGIAGSLAAAGGHLWVGAGTVDRVSLTTGRVEMVVNPRYRGPVQLVADGSGRVLVAGLGYEHPSYIARLDPSTGAQLSQVTVSHSVSQPALGGVIDGGAWIENTIGGRTSVSRLDLATLKATPPSGWPTSSERVAARVIDGNLWVTEAHGQDNVNFCADPRTGAKRGQTIVLPGDSVFLTADRTSIYYTYVPVNAHAVTVERAPISRACTT